MKSAEIDPNRVERVDNNIRSNYARHYNRALPFTSADLYARILSHEARKQSFDVTKEQLLDEVQVPDNRMPLNSRTA